MQQPLWKKLAWFAGLWLAGVLAVTVLAYGIRLMMGL
ncbi:DUF2474 family protein [Pseudomonas sp. Marseille-QA0892]